MFDPKGTGFVRRDDVCNALRWYPNEPGFLGDVEVLANDMSQRKRESVIKIILTTLATKKPKKEKLRMIKKKLEALYGTGWNVFIAEGRYWAVCSHKPGSNLTFIHRGVVYGVFQTPSDSDFMEELHGPVRPKKDRIYHSKGSLQCTELLPESDVHIIESDAPQHQRESIISIILGEMKHDGQPKEKLYRAKKRIEKLYGKEWNIFQAYGGYWGLCQYRVSTNLWFNHKGITYGAFQVPDSTDTIKSSRH
ncbi:Dynein light chain 1 cytoplasmic [Echinococcus granulosus]|uniref:Dynein light chain 1 cytoplasmic n=1 Tax=Echinococcus granulosus TaxID=6210 RepID=W6UUJ4_ECHGR|nr:Dynein light chain 1 cytoplasmic [Echinococcus granulosus]EUB64351.1 Dynein light chain 1 cytoplasmic [Echinococcus granulosus]